MRERQKIFLVESGSFGDGAKDLTRAFFEEEKAWKFVLRRYKTFHLERKNWHKQRGFRGVIYGRKRWISITEVTCS